jgi:cell division protein FtsL
MAVIGARPATGPWFLPGRSRPRPRPRRRPQSARRQRRFTAFRRIERRLDVRPLLVIIAVAAALGLFYLSQSTRVAAIGYEIDALEARLAESRAHQQQLIWAIGEARSPAEITRRARTELDLVPLEQDAVIYAIPDGTDAD